MLSKILNTTISKVIIAFCGLGVMILNTRYLGAEKLGMLALIMVAINLITQVSELIGGPAIVFLQKKHGRLAILFPSYLWATLVAVVGAFSFNLLAYNWATTLFAIVAIAIFQNINHVNLHYLVGTRSFKAYNFFTVFQILVVLSFLAFKYLIQKDMSISVFLDAYLYGQLCLFIGSSLGILLGPKLNNSKSDILTGAKVLFNSGLLVQLGNIFQFGVYRINYLILESFTSAATLGIYALGNQLSEKALIPVNAASLVQYSEVSNTDNTERAVSISIKMLVVAQLAALLCVIALMVVPTSFIAFVFGEEFSSVKNLFYILSMGLFFLANSVVFSHYFSGLGKFGLNTITSGIGVVCTIIFSFLLIPKFGMYGAAWASALVFFSQAVMQFFLFKSVSHLSWKILRNKYQQSFFEIISDVRQKTKL